MSDTVFRFRRFYVYNGCAAQKVGTDGVLLGALALLPACGRCRVLDIGTGTGVVALILAQRLSDAGIPSEITGIDIDSAAAGSAAMSFAESPWSDNLESVHTSLEDFSDNLFGSPHRFELIISNPPYYDNSLTCPDDRRSLARHTCGLSWREVITFAGDFLADDGRLAMILPKQDEVKLLRFAASFGFAPARLTYIRATCSKPFSRIVAEFVKGGCSVMPSKEFMTIGDEAYRMATKEFYLQSFSAGVPAERKK